MKKYETIFKIIVLVQLTIILIILFEAKFNTSEKYLERNKIGRYKEIKIKTTNGYGQREDEEVKILDT